MSDTPLHTTGLVEGGIIKFHMVNKPKYENKRCVCFLLIHCMSCWKSHYMLQRAVGEFLATPNSQECRHCRHKKSIVKSSFTSLMMPSVAQTVFHWAQLSRDSVCCHCKLGLRFHYILFQIRDGIKEHLFYVAVNHTLNHGGL